MPLRLYHPDDFPTLYAIEEVCFQPPVRYTARYLRSLVSRSNSITWVAEHEGDIAGFSILDIDPDPRGVLAYIQTIEVLPQHRKAGVGADLLLRMEQSARHANAFAIWLHVESTNEPAIRLYRAHGFELQGSQPNYYARGRNADIYSKSLAP